MASKLDQLNPLTDEHCDCLDKVLVKIQETRDLAMKCKNCGLDVDRVLEELNAQEQLATNLKANFFPNRH